ncbi:hypothetical protein BT69DRAFT_439807 [Atractiella rhizophila]|nr:hypothetical protein BT69DRAFT_439807 [Atractiella rhizophila]
MVIILNLETTAASQQILSRTRLLSFKLPLLPVLIIPPSEMHKKTGAAVDALECQLKAAGIRFVKFDQERIPVMEESRDVTETLEQIVKGEVWEEKVERVRKEGIRLWSEWMEVDMAARGGVASFHVSRHDQERWLDFSRRVAERRTELLLTGDDTLTQSRTLGSTQENWREVVERWRRAGGPAHPKSEEDNWSSQEEGVVSDLSSLTLDEESEKDKELAYLEDLYLDPFHFPSLLRLGLNIFTSMLRSWRFTMFGRRPHTLSPDIRSTVQSLQSTITMTKDDEKSYLEPDDSQPDQSACEDRPAIKKISLTGAFLACAAAYAIGWLVGSGSLERVVSACIGSRTCQGT